mmetsp:Transcript_26045/g.55716  ORF Transcript_26045/g.55716 Transcript_26045/m.55716 type:complete len:197 (+) Transcript_26045:631-1221(+)
MKKRLQEQIDMLSWFESSLSLDNVYQASAGWSARNAGSSMHMDCSKRRREGSGTSATGTSTSGSSGSGDNGDGGHTKVTVAEKVGFVILSIAVMCLYCGVVFGAIYMVMLLLQAVLSWFWNLFFGDCCGTSSSSASSAEAGEEEGDIICVMADTSEDDETAPLLATEEGYLPFIEEPSQDQNLDVIRVNPLVAAWR